MTTNDPDPGDEKPVTVSISRKIKPGHENEYEHWIHGIVEIAATFPGYQGIEVMRPSALTDGCYVLIYRYDSWNHSTAWENSEIRELWVERLIDIVDGPVKFHKVTGLEFWFDLPDVPATAKPSRNKMVLVLIPVVFVVVFPLQFFLLPLLADWPHAFQALSIIVIQVFLMTYLIMPRVTQVLKNWLFR